MSLWEPPGTGGLPDVQGFVQSRGLKVAVSRDCFPQTCPAFVDPALTEFTADHLHGLIGEGGDEVLAVAAFFELMTWTSSKCGVS